MAITQISQIQVRRGLNQDLPQLAAGELGWSTDTQQLYIGNGVTSAPDYAPSLGQTEILTQNSVLNFTNSVLGNITVLQGNVVYLQSEITALQNATGSSSQYTITATTNPVISFSANNATITYNLQQSTYQRLGTIRAERYANSTTVSFDEEYSQTGSTDVTFSITANATYATMWANSVSATGNLSYRIASL